MIHIRKCSSLNSSTVQVEEVASCCSYIVYCFFCCGLKKVRSDMNIYHSHESVDSLRLSPTMQGVVAAVLVLQYCTSNFHQMATTNDDAADGFQTRLFIQIID